MNWNIVMKLHRPPLRPISRLKSAPIVLAIIVMASAQLAVPTDAYAQPVRNSSLYYRMGGASPGGAANYRGQVAHNLGFGVNARLNYSCGKFDIGLSWSNIMNNIASLGQTITGAIQAGIAALPLYVLQRAQPGLGHAQHRGTRPQVQRLAHAGAHAGLCVRAALLGPDGQQGLQHTHERHVHAHEHG